MSNREVISAKKNIGLASNSGEFSGILETKGIVRFPGGFLSSKLILRIYEITSPIKCGFPASSHRASINGDRRYNPTGARGDGG